MATAYQKNFYQTPSSAKLPSFGKQILNCDVMVIDLKTSFNTNGNKENFFCMKGRKEILTLELLTTGYRK